VIAEFYFAMEIRGSAGRLLGKEDYSAGENQESSR